MSDLGSWHTDDFDSMSWHDVHVHGFRFASYKPDEGTADLILDIDYILKWEQSGNGFLFTVCRADLTFHDTFLLNLAGIAMLAHIISSLVLRFLLRGDTELLAVVFLVPNAWLGISFGPPLVRAKYFWPSAEAAALMQDQSILTGGAFVFARI